MEHAVTIVGLDTPESLLLADDHCEYRLYPHHYATTGRWTGDEDDAVDDVSHAFDVLLHVQ